MINKPSKELEYEKIPIVTQEMIKRGLWPKEYDDLPRYSNENTNGVTETD